MKLSQQRIRALMQREGFPTVAALSEASGVNRSHIYTMWDSDTATLGEIARLAKKLRATVGELVEEEPIRALQPCERPEYRALVDGLEALTVSERRAARELLQVFLMAMEGGRDFPDSDTPSVRNRTRTDPPDPVVPAGEAIDKPKAPPYRATTTPTKGRTRKPFDDGKSRGSSGKERKKRRP
jgi:hypothetical protein